MQVRKHRSEGSTLTLKPTADITRSPNQGSPSMVLQKRLVSSQFFKAFGFKAKIFWFICNVSPYHNDNYKPNFSHRF